MTKTQEAVDPKVIADALRELAYQVPDDLHERLDPILNQLTEVLKGTDMLALMAERNRVIADLRTVLFSETVEVKEEQCDRCNRKRGEVHGRGGCVAIARIDEARALIDES